MFPKSLLQCESKITCTLQSSPGGGGGDGDGDGLNQIFRDMWYKKSKVKRQK